MSDQKPKPKEDEKPDWERFERTVDRMLHTPPKPHEPLKARKPRKKVRDKG